MSDQPSVLLTNDDGIDAPGLVALRDYLRDRDDVGDVTVVAPADDESGVGLARSWTRGSLTVEERPGGYAVAGTPADCVAVGVEALDLDPDAVLSGVNDGPNVGAQVLARSGTIGAAMEAALLGYPAVAVSWYDLDYDYEGGLPTDLSTAEFALAARVAGDILGPFLAGDVFPDADYLTVNAPSPGGDPPVRVTRPSRAYEVEHDGDGTVRSAEAESAVELRTLFWRDLLDMDVPDPPGTDRRACVDGEVSVSPLSVPGSVHGDMVGDVLDLTGVRPGERERD